MTPRKLASVGLEDARCCSTQSGCGVGGCHDMEDTWTGMASTLQRYESSTATSQSARASRWDESASLPTMCDSFGFEPKWQPIRPPFTWEGIPRTRILRIILALRAHAKTTQQRYGSNTPEAPRQLGGHMGAAWERHESDMAATWQQHGSNMAWPTWRGNRMTTMWERHGNGMATS